MRTILSFLVAALAVAALGAAVATAEEPALPKLEKHPLADAKEGEFVRWKEAYEGAEKHYVQRVLGAKQQDGKTWVFLERWETTADGKPTVPADRGGTWLEVPEMKAKEHQEFKKDEMVVVEHAGKKLVCRHLKIEEQVNPPMPYPVATREVWYSNEVLANGKVKEMQDIPVRVVEATAWGTLTAEELAERQKANQEALQKGPPAPAAAPAPAPGAPPVAPPSGGGSSCGGGGGSGCGGGK